MAPWDEGVTGASKLTPARSSFFRFRISTFIIIYPCFQFLEKRLFFLEKHLNIAKVTCLFIWRDDFFSREEQISREALEVGKMIFCGYRADTPSASGAVDQLRCSDGSQSWHILRIRIERA